MRAITTKLLREVWKQRGQMLSIGAVVAAGIMTVLTMRGTYESLVVSQEQYYREARFPDVWANLERAPESLRRRIEDIPGVQVAETRVSFAATLDVPSVEALALGRFISIPDDGPPLLSELYLKTGRTIAPGRRNEVVISANFALANGYVPGDTLRAVVNGRYRDLEVVGTAISPEYTYAVPPGALYPDDQRYGIVWMGREALGPTTGLEGAFNEVALTYAPRADRAAVLARLDRLLEPYGGLGAYEREDQPSHAILQSELDSNRTMGTVIPIVFLLVAAFLLNIVMGRMIATQRTEIAVLKAFGYRNAEVGTHYFLFAMVAVMAGTAVGILLGIRAGGAMTQLYGDFFDFPDLRYTVRWRLVAIAVGVSALAAGVGALGAVRRAVALPPAEAMRPEPGTLGFGTATYQFRGRFVGGAEAHTTGSETSEAGGFETTLSGRYALVNVGVDLLRSPTFKAYPLVGVGYGDLTLRLAPLDDADFDGVLTGPGRGSSLTKRGFLLNAGLGSDLVLPVRANESGALGLAVGLRAGYLVALADNDWELFATSTALGAPEASLSGPYVRLLFGFSRTRR